MSGNQAQTLLSSFGRQFSDCGAPRGISRERGLEEFPRVTDFGDRRRVDWPRYRLGFVDLFTRMKNRACESET